jgi:predicted GNAT superfamily acetyltransferase
VEEPGALYIALGCVKPAYQDGVVGMKTMFRFREIALARGLSTIYAVHEPLEFNLARLYYGRIGYRGCGYSLDAGAAAIPMDKMKARWELDSPRVSAKLAGAKTEPLSRMLEDSPIARADRLPDAPRVLVELPPDFLALKRDDPAQAARVRQETRAILDELVNNRKYAVSDCVTGKMDGERRTFYVLEQPSAAQSSIRR